MYIPFARENFYSKRLTDIERRLYDSCVDNIAKGVMHGEVTLPYFLKREFSVETVIRAVLYGCPELFYINSSARAAQCGNEVSLQFQCKYDNIEEKRRQLYAEVDRIAARLRVCGSTYEKLCRLSRILGDMVDGANNSEGRFGDAYGALVLKEARCEGYAKAAKLILDKLGIRSVIVLGDAIRDGKKFPHSWNIAYCCDVPYGFDFTWNDGGPSGSLPGVIYTFLPDKDMNVEHIPAYPYPPCTDDSQTFWARGNSVIRTPSDISQARITRVDKYFVAAFKFEGISPTQELQKKAVDYVIAEVQKVCRCSQAAYYLNAKLNVLVVYCSTNN